MKNHLINYKINDETLNSFFNTQQIEKSYLKNLIIVEMGWTKLIRQIYESRININITEINEEIKKESKSIDHRKFAFFYSIEHDHSKRTQINR